MWSELGPQVLKFLLLLHQSAHKRAGGLYFVALLLRVAKGLSDDFRSQAFVASLRGDKSGFEVQDGVHPFLFPLVIQESVF